MRIDRFQERFENIEDKTIPKYFFGTHYSSPAITMQYLIRIKPFTKGAIALQSGHFDIADRIFFALSESYKGATEEYSDVRELIPEFFYLPEMFLNLDKNDFGVQQTGNRVHNVCLPAWANVYKLI